MPPPASISILACACYRARACSQFFNGGASVPHIEPAGSRSAKRPLRAAAALSPPTTPDQQGQVGDTEFPESPSGVEEQTTPKAGRWTKREDDLLRSAIDEFGTEVRATNPTWNPTAGYKLPSFSFPCFKVMVPPWRSWLIIVNLLCIRFLA